MKKPLKNLLVSIGAGYHPGVRMLHSMVKDVSDSRILLFQLEKAPSIDDSLRIDCSVKHDEFPGAFELFREWILENQFELIGISFMSHHWDIFVELTRIIRATLPKCTIIAGGVHAWLIDPMKTLEHCDYVCASEGEGLYCRFVEALSDPASVRPLRIPGLIEKYNNDIIHTPASEYMPMDSLPFPTVGSKDVYRIYSFMDKPVFGNEDPMLNSSIACLHIGRGCPFKCTYCINSLAAEKRKVRVRSVDKAIAELKMLLGLKKFKAFIFMDEIFPLQNEWLKEFARKYKEEIGIPFVITLYPGMLTGEKARLLKDAGLKEVSIGIQSGSENVRKNVYERTGTNDRIVEENKILAGLGVMTYYDFIIKNPFETEKDYRESLELVSRLRRPFYLKFYTLAYYPRHPITEMALDKKLIKEDEVSATIGYLDVTTPHKVAVADHYLMEDRLILWSKKLTAEMAVGALDAPYWLLISYYGYPYIPKFILSAVKGQYLKGRVATLDIFNSFIRFTLMLRNNGFSRKMHLVGCMHEQRGMGFVMKEIGAKVSRTLKRAAA